MCDSRRFSRWTIVAVVLLAEATAGAMDSVPQQVFTPITYPGAVLTTVYGINAEGAVVGQYQIAFAIPDAVAAAMVGLHGVVIRSPIVGTRYTGEVLDLARIAREAEVDTILTGTIARAGSRVRVTSQLLEVPGGTLIWSDPLRPLPGFTALSDRAAAKYRDACLAFADAGGQRLFGL